ncbi:MAG: YfhO family protein [Bacteroidota bacterium]|mgnify:CR=1 FL=1
MSKSQKKSSIISSRKESITDFSFLKDWHCLTLLALFLAIFFREIILGTSFFWEDFIYQFYPFRNFLAVSLSKGEVPLWNPYTFGGMPFAPDIQAAVFYLPNLLLVPFVSAGKLSAWTLEMFTIAHVYLAGVTMYYCAKAFGLPRIAATFTALVYMLSGFAIVHSIHLVMIVQLAWFPLIVLLFKKSLEEFSLTGMVLSGFCLSLSMLGGHPQFILYFFFFLLLYFLFELFHILLKEGFSFRIVQLSMIAAGVIVTAIGLSAIQLFPTLQLADISVRAEINYEKSLEGQLYWQQLITLLIPKFFGTANHLQAENPIRYWGPQNYWSFWETCTYIGICAFALAVFALQQFKTNRYVKFFAFFSLFAILYALGDNFFLHKLFYNVVPGFDKFRSIGRWSLFFTFSAAILGGMGLQQLFSLEKNKQKLLQWILTGVAGFVILVAILVNGHSLDSLFVQQLQTGAFKTAQIDYTFPLAIKTVTSQTMHALIVVLFSCAILFLVWKKILPATFGIILIIIMQFVDMSVFGFAQNNGKTNPEEYFAQRATLVKQLKEEASNDYFRINSRNRSTTLFDRNQGMVDNIFLMEGYTPLALQRIFPPAKNVEMSHQLMNVKYRLQLDTVRSGNQLRQAMRFAIDSMRLPRAFFVYDYRVFSSASQESLFMCSDEFEPRTMITMSEEPAEQIADKTPTAHWNASIEKYTNNSLALKVSTPKKGFLVVSEIFYPGWNAYIDGKQTSVYRADWSLRACIVDAGEHTVEMKFEPQPLYGGMKITFATMLLCCAVIGFDFYSKRKLISNTITNENKQ